MKTRTIKFLEGLLSMKDLLVYPNNTAVENIGEAQAIDSMISEARQILDELNTPTLRKTN
jgi:hypothetical protein